MNIHRLTKSALIVIFLLSTVLLSVSASGSEGLCTGMTIMECVQMCLDHPETEGCYSDFSTEVCEEPAEYVCIDEDDDGENDNPAPAEPLILPLDIEDDLVSPSRR